jgi:hypothetical protein
MRVVELLQAVLGETERVIITAGPVDLGPYVRFATGPVVEQRQPTELGEIGDGTLVVSHVDPDHLDQLEHLLGSTAPGGRAALLLEPAPEDIGWPALLGAFGRSSCQLLRVGALSYRQLRTGMLIARTDRLLLPLQVPLSVDAGVANDADFQATLRLANEYVVLDLQQRHAATLLRQRDNAPAAGDLRVQHGFDPFGMATRPEPSSQTDEEAAERGRRDLEYRLRDAERQLERAHARVRMLESSTSLKLGRTLIDAAHNPARASVDLPRQLARMWRQRQRVRSQPGATARREGQPGSMLARMAGQTGAESAVARALLGGAVRQHPGLAVLGVLSAGSRAALGPDSTLSLVVPHAAARAAEGSSADFLLVETAALLPGELWSGAGRPGEVARTRQLLRLVDTAQNAGLPVVLWRNHGHVALPGIRDLATRADLVVGDDGVGLPWNRGVQLALAKPSYTGHRAGIVCLDAFDVRRPAAEQADLLAAVTALAGEGARVYRGAGGDLVPRLLLDGGALAAQYAGDVDLEAALALYRRASVVVGGGDQVAPLQVLEQLACATRVVWLGTGLSEDLRGVVTTVDSPDAVLDAVRAATAAGPVDPEGIRGVRRVLFPRYTTQDRLGELAQLLGLRQGSPRGVSLLARLDSRDRVPLLINAVLNQRLRPDELVVAAPGLRPGDSDLDEVRAIGIDVVEVPEASRWKDLALLARQPWVAPLRLAGDAPGWLPDALTDVLAAQASSSAAVVVDETTAHPVCLVRRGLLEGSDGEELPLERWTAEGAHVFRFVERKPVT